MKKIAVILSGCGFLDGTEITEAVSTIVCLSEQGVSYDCFAPNQDFPTTNHLNSEARTEKRNALTEAARICRGQIQPLNKLNANDFDGLVLPGGFGAALNLSTWGREGHKCSVLPDMEKALIDFHKQSKPIGAICISPTLIARVLGKKSPCITIGEDSATASEIEKTGAHHETCPVTDYITDRETKVITTPAYMYEALPHEVFLGIRGLIKELCEMA